MDDDDKIYCTECGELVSRDEVQWYDGEAYCESCFNDNFTICEDCNEIIPIEDSIYLDDYNRTVCQDCLNDDYFQCEHCDTYLHRDDVFWGADDQPYCENCFYDFFTVCDNCGEIVGRDDVYYADDDRYLCENCYYQQYSNVIYSYHSELVEYLPRYDGDIEMDAIEHAYDLYGIELEITGSKSTAEEFQNIMGDDVVLMRDSSVEGYEMVSMPMTRAYFYNHFIKTLNEGLTYLRDNDMSGHNGGGIHIHFRELGAGLQTANATQILYGNEIDRKIWQMISQRKNRQLNWCSMTNNNYSPREIFNDSLSSPAGSGNHGTALNYDNRTRTHELRIFNSNLRLERVIKNMECLFALEDYIKSTDRLICSTRGYLDYVDQHADKYPFLVSFLKEKNIFKLASLYYNEEYLSNQEEGIISYYDSLVLDDRELLEV